MDNLRECPFCGGIAELKSVKAYRKIRGHGQSFRAVIGCRGCPAQVSQATFDTETAIQYAKDMWNARHSPKPEALTKRNDNK